MKGQKMMLEKSRNFIESVRFPIAIFSYENHKVKIVMASQGYLKMKAPTMEREEAIAYCEENLYKNIKKDDLKEYQALFEQFLLDEKRHLDLLMNMHVYGREDYSLIHVKGII